MIVAIGVIVIWLSLQAVFGTQNPFYVVSSGSMIPELQVHDVLVVQGHIPFEEVKVGDVIVFERPAGHDRVIVHRVASIIDDNPKTIRTKGDANPASIPGTDFPITEAEYIGKVAYVIPQVGFVTRVLSPPINYIIIAIIIGAMIFKQITKKKNEKEITMSDPIDQKKEDIVTTDDISVEKNPDTKPEDFDKKNTSNKEERHESDKETKQENNQEKK